MWNVGRVGAALALAGTGAAAAVALAREAARHDDAASLVLPSSVLAGAGTVAMGLVHGGRAGGIAASLGAGLLAGTPAPMLVRGGGMRSPGAGVDHAPDFHVSERNLAVAWWPVQMGLERDAAGSGTFRFTSLVANLGSSTMPVAGARFEYEVFRRRPDGGLGERVGSGSVPLNRLELTEYPPPFGVEVGRPLESFGAVLQGVRELAPATAGIVGAVQPGQQLRMSSASDGLYVLRQRIVHDPAVGADEVPLDDVRDTDFMVRDGVAVELGSGYAE